MMKECGFCDYTGKMSAEHIVSEWMRGLFPGPIRARYGDAKEFKTDSMDWKTRVVCAKCNNTWMSNIESQHAKPVLTPLMRGVVNLPIGLAESRSIALFAFKTAMVLDLANRDRTPFYSRRIRHAFKEHGNIPPSVQMWLCGYAGHRGGGQVRTLYHEGRTADGYTAQMYACTCAFGHFVFQVLGVKQIGEFSFRSLAPFKPDLAVPFWPRLVRNFVWPHRVALKSRDEFIAFSDRWQKVEIIG
jgi:hypothetical protein